MLHKVNRRAVVLKGDTRSHIILAEPPVYWWVETHGRGVKIKDPHKKPSCIFSGRYTSPKHVSRVNVKAIKATSQPSASKFTTSTDSHKKSGIASTKQHFARLRALVDSN